MLKLTQTNAQKVYFTSDWHLGHQKDFVWEARGYSSYEEHTREILDTTNSIVRPNDILFMLGDFCLNTPIERFHEYLAKVNCKNLWMLWGNHNNPHERKIYRPLVGEYLSEGVKTRHEVYPLPFNNAKYLGHYMEVSVDGQVIILFHYPISVWNYMQHGAWHLCGHSHYNFIPSTAEDTTARILDVGWDGHKRPLSMEDIAPIMEKKQVPTVDHHVSEVETEPAIVIES